MQHPLCREICHSHELVSFPKPLSSAYSSPSQVEREIEFIACLGTICEDGEHWDDMKNRFVGPLHLVSRLLKLHGRFTGRFAHVTVSHAGSGESVGGFILQLLNKRNTRHSG